MRTTQPAAIALLTCAALALCSCTTKGERSDIVLTGVVLSKFTAATAPATGGTCACPTPPATETESVAFASLFAPCLSLENRLVNNGDGKLRLNTNDLIIDDVQVSYESTTSTALNVPTQTIPMSGFVPANGKATIPTTLVPGSVQLPSQALRLHFFIDGHLLDGSKVKSSEYEYIAIHVPGTASDNCNY